MADIDIFSIQPHQVSRDLRGYSVFFYGGWKIDITTGYNNMGYSMIGH